MECRQGRSQPWSVAKAEANRDKHGVSFEEAHTAFDDPFQVAWYDPDHDRLRRDRRERHD
jgi:uncharacterized DUF497 family protein